MAGGAPLALRYSERSVGDPWSASCFEIRGVFRERVVERLEGLVRGRYRLIYVAVGEDFLKFTNIRAKKLAFCLNWCYNII